MPSARLQSLSSEISKLPDKQLLANVRETARILKTTATDGYTHWIIAFSGGKDSSLTVVLAIEMLRRGTLKNVKIDVVYSDTLMELPPFGENAIALLRYISKVSTNNNLPVRTFSAVAPIEHRFWFLLLGKGYPPPHNHFRWCTERLKIWPSAKVMEDLITKSSIVLTGVRWDESIARATRMKAALCSKDDSECGQGAWMQKESAMGIPSLAPIAHWQTCKVWDFLMMADAWWGWPFKSLNRLYGENGATRFGCWMCTLVKEDKALKAITQHSEWSRLSALGLIRQEFLEEGRKEKNRIAQPSGNLGRTSLEFRKRMLDEVLELQDRLGSQLVSPEEVTAIQAYWKVECKTGTPYTPECKFWKWSG